MEALRADAAFAQGRMSEGMDDDDAFEPDELGLLGEGGGALLATALPETERVNMAPGGMKLPSYPIQQRPWRHEVRPSVWPFEASSQPILVASCTEREGKASAAPSGLRGRGDGGQG